MSESAAAAVETPIKVPEYVALYRLAFAVARALRIEGNMPARFLAERIERACRAAV
jgi:hypothetical protein